MSPIVSLFDNAHTRHFPKGQIVIYEGDPVRRLYHIDSGYVKVYNILASGTERIIFIYGPGDMFPLTSYLSGFGITRYFYECMQPAKLRVMEQDQFERKLKGNLVLGEQLIDYSYRINQQFVQRIDALSVNDARRKIIALLAFLLSKVGDSKKGSFGFYLTSQDFADMSGLTRETASVQLNKLRDQGVLSGTRELKVDVGLLNKLQNKYSIPKFT